MDNKKYSMLRAAAAAFASQQKQQAALLQQKRRIITEQADDLKAAVVGADFSTKVSSNVLREGLHLEITAGSTKALICVRWAGSPDNTCWEPLTPDDAGQPDEPTAGCNDEKIINAVYEENLINRLADIALIYLETRIKSQI